MWSNIRSIGGISLDLIYRLLFCLESGESPYSVLRGGGGRFTPTFPLPSLPDPLPSLPDPHLYSQYGQPFTSQYNSPQPSAEFSIPLLQSLSPCTTEQYTPPSEYNPSSTYYTAAATEYIPATTAEYSVPCTYPYIDYPINYSQCIASPPTI